MADVSADSAEIVRVQRMAAVYPPPRKGTIACKLCIVVSADGREQAAEDESAIEPQRRRGYAENTERMRLVLVCGVRRFVVQSPQILIASKEIR